MMNIVDNLSLKAYKEHGIYWACENAPHVIIIAS